MEKINNKNGIKMFYERANDIDKINILDSNGNYFNDIYFDIYEDDKGAEDIQAILHTLEETTLENMCNFFGARKYSSIEELEKIEEVENLEYKEFNEYLNEFNVNDKTYYTWSW